MTANEDSQKNVEALLVLLHQLDVEYGEIRRELNSLAGDAVPAGKDLAGIIVDMSRRSEELRASHQPLVDALNGALRGLCEQYLEAQEDQRTRIRNAFSGQKTLLVHLINLTGTACLSIPRGDGAYWLRIALAAVSIEDNRTDYRDTHMVLQHLYPAAVKADIDPKKYFRQVAALSSDAMRAFLSDFAGRYP